MLGDFHPHGKVAQDYGVFDDDRGTANRAVFIVDKEGVVRFSRVYGSAGELDPADILAEVARL